MCNELGKIGHLRRAVFDFLDGKRGRFHFVIRIFQDTPSCSIEIHHKALGVERLSVSFHVLELLIVRPCPSPSFFQVTENQKEMVLDLLNLRLVSGATGYVLIGKIHRKI